MKLDMRVLQIDLARQKEKVEFVKKYADFAKECGYNYLVLYLENAIRTKDTEFFNKEDTYSMTEMKEMVDYIESLGLKVIPNFENYSHIEKFLEYPELSDLSELVDEKTTTRGYSIGGVYYRYGTCGCPTNPKLNEFFDKYLTDCMECFKNSEYVLMGLDEIWDLGHCEKCKERIKKGESKEDIFYEQVMHTYRLVKSWGKTMIIADDFFEYADISERIPKDIILDNWNYGYVGTEPGGHWVGNRKRDWLRWYDKLGLTYIFSVKAISETVMNTDTFTRYASKFSPIGGFTTAWCRANGFYYGFYPYMYYTARYWLGEIKTEEDRIEAFAYLFDGNKELAKLLLANNLGGFGGGLNFTERIENENENLYNYLIRTELLVEKIRGFLPQMKGRSKLILLDIYNGVFEGYLNAKLGSIGNLVFDSYETDGKTDKFIPEIEKIEKGFNEIKANAEYLWTIDRGEEIKSFRNAFENKYGKYEKNLKEIKDKLSSNQKWGTLTGEYMLHDIYGTPTAEVIVNYIDGESTSVFKGQLKPSLNKARFSVRYKIENKIVDSIIFSCWAEGACYPSYFYTVINGEKYIPSEVEILSGKCERVEKILVNDSGFLIMGYEDGLKCFEDELAMKKIHSIKVKLNKL